MNKLFITLFLSLFIISSTSAAITVDLNSPADESIAYNNSVTFNATAEVTGGATLENISLWTNQTGSWEIRNTTSVTVTISETEEHEFGYTGVEAGVKPKWGFKILTKSAGKITKITKQTATLATTAYILDSSYGILATATFSGDNATFDYTVTNNTAYYVVADSGVSSYSGTVYVGGVSYPVSGTYIDWTSGTRDGVDGIQADNIKSIDFAVPSTTTTQTFNQTLTDTTLWNIQSCDSDGDCGFATSNYTVILDSTPPIISVENPTGTLDYNYIGGLETLNVTFTDTNLESCWYNYNGTNITIEGCKTGIKNSTQFILEKNNYNMTIYANDSVGNLNSEFIEWDYILLEQELIYNNNITEGELNTFTEELLVADGYQISSAIFNYNGINYSTSIEYSSGEYTISSSQYAPLVDSDTNVSFGFYITIDDIIYNPSINNQTVYDLTFTVCGGGSDDTLLTLYLKDEILQTALTGDIEISANLISKSSGQVVETLSHIFSDVTSGSICFSPNSSYDLYYLDAEIRYSSDGYSSEYYIIQNSDLANYPANLSLYDLNLSSSTEFLIKYQDDNLITVEGAVIQLLRKYINTGSYEVVEAPLTSNIGTAVVHIDLNTNLYKAIVVKDGVILDVFDNLVFHCESELSGTCEQNLFGSINPQNSVSVENLNDFSYLVSSVNETITTTFSMPSGVPAEINIVLEQIDTFGNSYLCNQTITSSGGSIDCSYNETIGDSLVNLYIYKNGVLQVYNQYFIAEAGTVDWLGNNFFIVFLLLLSIVGMAMASPEWMIMNAVFTMILCGGIWLLAGLDFVAGMGTMVWLLTSAIILIFKMTKQEDR